ncbi:MAG: phosphate acetyltransferase [Devosiaceae bacterium]|nr:phosphate acetyltransferase [Devosiaceae bacterium]
MKPVNDLIERAKTSPKHIVLAEGDDARVMCAAIRAAKEGVAQITLLGDGAKIGAMAEAKEMKGLPISIINSQDSKHLARFSAAYRQLRAHKKVSAHVAHRLMTKPLNFAAMMVHLGLADGTLSGAVFTSGQTMRAALHIIGKSPRYDLISSFFIMLYCGPDDQFQGPLIFSDCALNVDPTGEDLAQIAITSADSAAHLLGVQARVAMLSFSTFGSANHPLVQRVREGTRLAKELRADLIIEGEIQLDAALVPEVHRQKAANSCLEGRANVLVFPNLMAGNIGYKIAHRLGGAMAIGPIMQGLAKPANDLSRGCNANDIFHMIATTAVQAQAPQS